MATSCLRLRLTVASCLMLSFGHPGRAQHSSTPDIRTVAVTEPILILEAVAGAGLDEWSPGPRWLSRHKVRYPV
jgi:hypothetical protein